MRCHSVALAALVAAPFSSIPCINAWAPSSHRNNQLAFSKSPISSRTASSILTLKDAAAAPDSDNQDDGTFIDVSVPYNAAARLAYDEWRSQFLKPQKASQKVLGLGALAFDSVRFAVFEANYNAVTVANVMAKRSARLYGGEPEIVQLGPDADTAILFEDIIDEDEDEDTSISIVNGVGVDTDIDVSIDYNAAALLAYDDWRATNNKGPFDESKFAIFEQNYVAATVANVSAKKESRESGEEANLVELGTDADESLLSFEVKRGLDDVDETIFSVESTLAESLSTRGFGEKFGDAFKWKRSSDDRLRSALGIEASPEDNTPGLFFAEGDKRIVPQPPNASPSEKVLKTSVIKETNQVMENQYNISLPYEKIRELLDPIFSGKVEANVPTDAIKGAALAGAAIPILAGAKGAGLSLAALSALSSSYLAVTQGYAGEAARTIGSATWKSTGALKTVGSATKSFVSSASELAKEKNRERMLDDVAKGNAEAAAKLDRDVQRVVAEAEAEAAVASAEKAARKQRKEQGTEKRKKQEEEAARAAEQARLEDELLLAQEFEKARMAEMRAEAAAQAQQQRMEEDQRRAEEEAARLAEEDRLAAEAEAQRIAKEEEKEKEVAQLEEEANRLLAQEERRIAAMEEETRLAAEAEAAMLAAEEEAALLTDESEKLHSLQEAAEDADIAAQARAAVEAMEAQTKEDDSAEMEEDIDIAAQARAAVKAMEAQINDEDLAALDEDDEDFLTEEDLLEASIALAQEMDGKIAGADDFLTALNDFDENDEFDDIAEDEPVPTRNKTEEQYQSPEDLARLAREAVALYESEVAGRQQEIEVQRAEWVAEAAEAAEAKAPEQESTLSPSVNWEKMTVVMLKNELRSRGLKVSGRKAELIQRLLVEEDEST